MPDLLTVGNRFDEALRGHGIGELRRGKIAMEAKAKPLLIGQPRFW